jgi:hypothetical protein
MFEKALITRVGNAGVDFGALAETILFYGCTHLLLNRGSVVSLATKLSPDDLLALLDRGEVRLSYLRPGYGVVTAGPFGAHNFGAITLQGHKEDAPPRKGVRLSYKEEIEKELRRAIGDSATTRKLARDIADRLALHTFKGAPDGENVIVNLAKRDITDPTFTQGMARVVLEHLLPADAIPPSFRFAVIDTGSGYLVDTDLNFERLNGVYHHYVPPSHSSITEAYILSHAASSRVESYFAAEYMAELVTTPLQSSLIRLKHYEFLRAREKSGATIEMFRDINLPGFPSIREVINSGDRTIAEFLKLLDQAAKFRDWLRAENPDRGLLAGYVKAATEKTWADQLPTKTTRWAVATGLGLAVDMAFPTGLGTLAGVAVGGLDTFFLDKFIKGWRPNHFIEGPYKEFVEKK